MLILYFVYFFLINRYLRISTKFQKNIIIFIAIIISIGGFMIILCESIVIFRNPGSTEYMLTQIYKNNKRKIIQEIIPSLPLCYKCSLPKPPRAHHCSVCQKCYIRMDHHCSFLGVCIAFNNHRAFIAFLHWAVTTLFLASMEMLFSFFVFKIDRILSSYLFLVCFVIFIFLAGFLHKFMNQIRKGQTTIEKIDNDDQTYSLGVKENLRQMFGSTKIIYRFWPSKSSFEGFGFYY